MKTLTASPGFTLIELLVTVTVMGVALTLGVPSLMDTVQNNRMSAKINELVTDVNLARSEALKRGKSVTLCKRNSDGTACVTGADAWLSGWIVFLDNDSDGTVDVSDVILRVHGALTGLSKLDYSRNRITFDSSGFAVGFTGTLTFCDSRGVGKAKGLVLSNTGRLRSAGSTDTLACP